MKKQVFITVLLILVNTLLIANTYYVATTGNNSNSGSINSPWGTWQKAFDTAIAGDTVYFRDGVWYPQTTAFQASICLIDPLGTSQPSNLRGHSGTKENPICYFNYPGEKPVLDCRHVTAEGNYLEGLNVSDGVHYIHFKGLEIRNVWQKGKLNLSVNGMSGGGRDGDVSNLTLENMSIHDIGGRGLWLGSANGHFGITNDTMRIINSDFYNCADTFMTHQFNLGDGLKGDLEPGGVMILDGCRFWNNSDDGVDLSGPGQKILNNCWAFNMGNSYKHIYYPDDGNGFKLGAVRDSISIPNWIMSNCISAGNLRVAIHELDFNNYRNNARVYNSVFYKNEEGPSSYTNVDRSYHNTEFYNCISYANTGRQVMIYTYPYPESNNSWKFDAGPSFSWIDNPAVQVTDDDFVSLDINELSRPRKADGSLPDVSFMHLAEGSDLIDAGTKTTLSGKNIDVKFTGSTPDMGVFEYVKIHKENIQICGGSYKGQTISGTFTEKLIGKNGGDSIVSTLLTVNEIPLAPVVSLSNGILSSNVTNANQWYFNNNIIPNAINNTYVPSQQGNYTSRVTLNTCTSQPSNSISFVSTPIIDIANANFIKVHPNPTIGLVKVSVNNKFDSDYFVDVYNSVGGLELLLKKSITNTDFDLDFTTLSKGLYIIRIYNSDKVFQTKVLKK